MFLARIAGALAVMVLGCSGADETKHVLAGRIQPGALRGVAIRLEGARTAATTTDTDGSYTFRELADGRYTVTPSLGGFTFTPSSRSIVIGGGDVAGQDFAASADLVSSPCAVQDEGTEQWPQWSAGDRYSTAVQTARAGYVNGGYDWRLFYLPRYFANGDYLSFATARSFDPPGPEAKLDADGVPMFLAPDGTYHYHPVQLEQFALHLHSRHLRGEPLSPAFWIALDHLLSTQDGTGAFRYDFAIGVYAPGWASALAQGQALSVLGRAYMLRADQRYLTAGDQALEYLLMPVSLGGVRDDLRALDPSLSRYLFLQEWPAGPPNYTLNGFMFTGLGLYDWASLGLAIGRRSPTHEVAGLYFACSVQTISRVLTYYDVGGYSTYNLMHVIAGTDPAIAPYYHSVHLGLLQAYSTLTARPEFGAVERQWAAYVEQPIPAP